MIVTFIAFVKRKFCKKQRYNIKNNYLELKQPAYEQRVGSSG